MSTLKIYVAPHAYMLMPITPDLIQATQDIIDMDTLWGDDAYELGGDRYQEAWMEQRHIVSRWISERLGEEFDWDFDKHNDYLDLDWMLRCHIGVA